VREEILDALPGRNTPTEKNPNLFDWKDWPPAPENQKYPDFPGHKGAETSRQAAEKIAPTVKAAHRQILAEFGPGESLSADEIAKRIERSPYYVRPRVSELVRLGKLVRSTERTVNAATGMSAAKWRLANA